MYIHEIKIFFLNFLLVPPKKKIKINYAIIKNIL